MLSPSVLPILLWLRSPKAQVPDLFYKPKGSLPSVSWKCLAASGSSRPQVAPPLSSGVLPPRAKPGLGVSAAEWFGLDSASLINL